MGKNQGGPKTPFWHFCKKMQDEFRRKGKEVSLPQMFNMPDVAQAWANLTEEQRLPFKEAAKAFKAGKSAAPMPQVFHPSFNASSSFVNNSVHESTYNEGNDEDFAYSVLNQYLESLTLDEVMKQHWIFFATNIMVATSDDQFIPLELGFVKYSMDKGLIGQYNQFVEPGSIPMGYASQAHAHAENHKIPLSNFGEASNEYDEILVTIKEFMSSAALTVGSRTYHLICSRGGSEDQIEQNAGALKWIEHKAKECAEIKAQGGDDPDAARNLAAVKQGFETFVGSFIYIKAEELLKLLLEKKREVPEPIAICEDKMTRTKYDYQPHTACEFHTNQDKELNCAQGVARRLSYLLTDAAAEVYEFNPTPQHIPENAPVTLQDYTIEFRKARLPRARPFSSRAEPSDRRADEEDNADPIGPIRQPSLARQTGAPSAPARRLGIGRGSRPPSSQNPY